MSLINNLRNVKIDNVYVAGRVSFGQAMYNDLNYNEKVQGANATFGTGSETNLVSINDADDSDMIDQGTIASKSSPISSST